MPEIAVIDYGAGNLHSVCNALKYVGAPFFVAREPADVARGSAILLPGVGHFGQMMQALDAAGLAEPLREALRAGAPYLGICLGMQALFEGSEEAPTLRGLGLLRGHVKRFPPGERVPHMGWTPVEPSATAANGALLLQRDMFYFAHSYYVAAGSPGEATVARHGFPFVATIETGNLAGCQFHPEKSGRAGLAFLQRWVETCRQNA